MRACAIQCLEVQLKKLVFFGSLMQSKHFKFKTDACSEQLTPGLQKYLSVTAANYMPGRKEIKYLLIIQSKHAVCLFLY